jgi:flagellar M-ring protein FliF
LRDAAAGAAARVGSRSEKGNQGVNGILQSLRSLGATRVIALGAVGVGMFAFFFFLITRLTAPDYALLYGDLPLGDSSQIVTQLESEGVAYRLTANGTQILVPSDQVLRLRLRLAEQGLPSGGSVGYEVFDDASSLGTTRFVQNINLVRALEGELARTISSLDRVRAARVHLVLPKRELFQRDKNEPTASVFVRLNGGARLPQNQISSIQHLVAAAVPGLAPERVAIVDGRGNLLASGAEDESELGFMATRADEFRRGYELELKRTLEELLEQSLGAGKVRAEVAATINFDRVTSNAEIFDPDGQVVRSTQTIEDQTTSREGGGAGSVSVGNNLPSGEAGATGGGEESTSVRTEETVNFEISRTVRSYVQETGRIERLSVAILVDGSYQVDPDTGERSYTPRNEEVLAQIATLVRSAIGFDADRGDTLEVINMRFSESETVELPVEPMFGLHKSDYIKIGEILVLALVAILVILLVLRPLISRLFAMQLAREAPAGAAAPGAVPGPQGQPMLPGPEGAAAAAAAGAGVQPGAAVPGLPGAAAAEPESMIDISKVEGRVKASSAAKMGEIIDKHPDEALTILRGWMAEGSS